MIDKLIDRMPLGLMLFILVCAFVLVVVNRGVNYNWCNQAGGVLVKAYTSDVGVCINKSAILSKENNQ